MQRPLAAPLSAWLWRIPDAASAGEFPGSKRSQGRGSEESRLESHGEHTYDRGGWLLGSREGALLTWLLFLLL